MTTDPKNELLPCPFGEDHKLADYTKNNGKTKLVYCDDGDCPIHGVDIEQTAWNTRPAKAVQGDIESVLTQYERHIVANTPMGDENKRLSASTFNWRKHVLAEIRAMVPSALTPESEGIAGKGDADGMGLVWSEERPPNDDIRYDHVVSETPLGRITIEWKSWKDYGDFVGYLPWDDLVNGDTLEEAKTNVHHKWNEKVAECQSAITRPQEIDVDALANFIRTIDGGHVFGAGELAEKIAGYLSAPSREEELMAVIADLAEDLSAARHGLNMGKRPTAHQSKHAAIIAEAQAQKGE